MKNMISEVIDRAYGSLVGLAIGDAMGMPSSAYTPKQVKQLFGVIKGFINAPRGHPIHDGLKAGQVTDDTRVLMPRDLYPPIWKKSIKNDL